MYTWNKCVYFERESLITRHQIFKRHVLAFYCCFDKLSQTWWHKTMQINFLTVLEARNVGKALIALKSLHKNLFLLTFSVSWIVFLSSFTWPSFYPQNQQQSDLSESSHCLLFPFQTSPASPIAVRSRLHVFHCVIRAGVLIGRSVITICKVSFNKRWKSQVPGIWTQIFYRPVIQSITKRQIKVITKY